MIKKILYYILFFLVIVFIFLIYSRFVGTKGLKTNEYLIRSNIEESYNGLKIIHFSDLHYKKVITEKRIKELIKEINKNKPDIVIFTGDLVDKDYKLKNKDINFLIDWLSKIESTYGTYSILGDHDYSDIDTINNIYIQSNITLLDNNYTIVHNKNNDKLLIVGISSYLKNKDNISNIKLPNDNFLQKIYLVHEPDYINNILNNNPSMILAGHSINGSINIPLIKNLLLPDGARKYYNSYYNINNTNIYISNGIGVNNINFRLFNTPSINLYRFKKSN